MATPIKQAIKPATPLPVTRHFDCMKKCPMACTIACKRAAYPELVAALRAMVEQAECLNAQQAFGPDYANARALLAKLGEG